MSDKKIFLLIDDDDDDRDFFEEVLQEVDATANLQTAANGSEALELLDKYPDLSPQLIFLDLNMPRMNGKEFLRYLKSHEALKAIPVVIYTTSTHASDIAEARLAGATGYITKPTNVQDLRKLLTKIVTGLPSKLDEILKDLMNVNLFR